MKKNVFIMYERDQPNKNTFIGRKRLSSVTCNANEWSWMKYSEDSKKNELRENAGFRDSFSKEIVLAHVVYMEFLKTKNYLTTPYISFE